jgi:radical SAM protein with 4Fe4S-binding SPASM domain
MEAHRKKDEPPWDRQDSIIFEITQRCNLSCCYCYNVWKNRPRYPRGELATRDIKRLLEKAVAESRCRLVTLTGGEPLLREDIVDVVRFVRGLGVEVNLISNGTLLESGAVRSLVQAGVRMFELPLLSARRETHNRLVGGDAFDRVTEAVADVKLAGGLAVAVFIAMEDNIGDFEEVTELAFVLGVDGIMLNRFNPGGEGARRAAELLPSPAAMSRALEVADRAVEKYGIPVSSSIALQPCLIDISRYRNVSFGFCAAGSPRAYYTLDSLGNLRMCNHTPSILGNLFDEPFRELAVNERARAFTCALPAFCRGCSMAAECQGGCKAAAESCYGDITLEDPFLTKYAASARRPV